MVILLSILLGFFAHSQSQDIHPKDISEFQRLFPRGQVYAGFGLARDMISSAYLQRPFQPRDYDLVLVGTGVEEAEAMERLAKVAKFVRRVDTQQERFAPNGNVFANVDGYVLIFEKDGVQFDFKFFDSIDDAHRRGFTNTERVLLKVPEQGLGPLWQRLVDSARVGKRPPVAILSDPFHGVEAILEGSSRTVDWAKARALPFEWILRTAMIHAKIGDQAVAPEEKEAIRQALQQKGYIVASDRALLARAIKHERWYRVREILQEVGFFEKIKDWRWSESLGEVMGPFQDERRDRPACRRLFM